MNSTNFNAIICLLLSLIVIAIALGLMFLFSLTFFKILKTLLLGEKISLVPYSKVTEKMYEESFLLAHKRSMIVRLLFKSRRFKSPANPKGIVSCLNHKQSYYYPRRFPNMKQTWPLKYLKDSKGRILLVHAGYRTLISLITLVLVLLILLFLLFSGIQFLLDCGQELWIRY